MDQPSVCPTEHRAALADLSRLNALSLSVRPLWRALVQLSAGASLQRPLRVLDLACGAGDGALRLAELAKRHQIPMTIHGCDCSATALSVARENALRASTPHAEFFALDVLNDPLPRDYDVIACSLFLHHLSDNEAPRVLRAMTLAAQRAVLVSDLLRTRLGYALCWAATRALSRSKIVHIDGSRSIRAAFSTEELHDLIQTANLKGATVTYHWPERFLLTWERLRPMRPAGMTAFPPHVADGFSGSSTSGGFRSTSAR